MTLRRKVTQEHGRVLSALARLGPLTSAQLGAELFPEVEPLRKRANHAAMLASMLRRRAFVHVTPIRASVDAWIITPDGVAELARLERAAAILTKAGAR